MTEGKLIQDVHGYVSWAKNGAFKEKHCANKIIESAKAYAAAENQRLRDMLKAIIDHGNEPAMDDALFRKFARVNAQDVLGIVDETTEPNLTDTILRD